MLTLIIPTFNRPQFLARLLGYYRELSFPYTIVVADSSDAEHLIPNEAIINSVRPDLTIEHRTYDTDIGIATKLAESLETVGSPYSVLAADDDFFVPESLRRGAEFLEANPDYSVVHGEAAKFGLPPEKAAYGPIVKVSRYNQRTVEFATGSERLVDHLVNGSTTWYSIQRTEQLRGNYRKTVEFESGAYFIELLPSCLSLIQGKAKKLDRLYMLRQTHSGSFSSSAVPLDWVASPDWTGLYERFCSRLAEELAAQDGMGLEEAQRVVRRSFWPYLAGFLGRSGSKRRKRSPLLRAAGAVPGVRPVWRKLLRLKQRSGGDMSLASLRHPSSPYHADFMPIYEAVKTPPVELDAILS